MLPKSPVPAVQGNSAPSLVAVLVLLLACSLLARTPDSLALEQRRLQGFIDALQAEGAVQSIAPCRAFEACVRVTGVFLELERGDRRGVGQWVRDYFAHHPDGPRFVTRVRFIDHATGIELGGYVDGRLEWEGRF